MKAGEVELACIVVCGVWGEQPQRADIEGVDWLVPYRDVSRHAT